MYLMMYTSFSTSVKANNFRDGCVAFIHGYPSIDEEDKSFYRVPFVKSIRYHTDSSQSCFRYENGLLIEKLPSSLCVHTTIRSIDFDQFGAVLLLVLDQKIGCMIKLCIGLFKALYFPPTLSLQTCEASEGRKKI